MATSQIDLRLPATPEAAGRARRALTPLRGRLPDEKLGDIELLVSELVTNSIRHAGLSDTGSVSLNVHVRRRQVRVEVADAGPGFRRPAPTSDPAALPGWGLYLVERLADRWGIQDEDRTCVWFEIDLAG